MIIGKTFYKKNVYIWLDLVNLTILSKGNYFLLKLVVVDIQ